MCMSNQCEGMLWSPLDTGLTSKAERSFDVEEGSSKPSNYPRENNLRISAQWAQLKHQWFSNWVWPNRKRWSSRGHRSPSEQTTSGMLCSILDNWREDKKLALAQSSLQLPGPVLSLLHMLIQLGLSTTLWDKLPSLSTFYRWMNWGLQRLGL